MTVCTTSVKIVTTPQTSDSARTSLCSGCSRAGVPFCARLLGDPKLSKGLGVAYYYAPSQINQALSLARELRVSTGAGAFSFNS